MNTVVAMTGIIGIGVLLASFAESMKQAETQHRVEEYLCRRGWLRVWDVVEDLGLELNQAEFWLHYLSRKGKVVQSKRGAYYRWTNSITKGTQ